MLDKQIRICIVGGGFGGLYTALHLNRHPQVKSGRWQLFLIEPKEHFLFTPLLYEMITGELQRWQIAPSYRQLLKETKVRFINKKASFIGLDEKEICLEDGSNLVYDYLVLSAGSKNRSSSIPGLSELALTFRTLEDAELLNAKIHHLETGEKLHYRVAVIGGGANGVELACKLADRFGSRGTIQLIESGGEILKYFPSAVRTVAYRALLNRGVQISLNTSVESVGIDSLWLNNNGRSIMSEVDLIVQALGTEPGELVGNINCRRTAARKLLVRPSLQLLDYQEVFALGDMAEIYKFKKFVPSTAQAAYQASTCVAQNLSLLIQNKPLKTYKYFHLGDMLTLGRKYAIVSSQGIKITGELGDKIRRFVYILRLPTSQHQLKVLKHWLNNTLLKMSKWLGGQYKQIVRDKSISS